MLRGPTAAPDQRGINATLPSTIRTPIALAVGDYPCGTQDVPITAVTLINPHGVRLLSWAIDNGTGDKVEQGASATLASLGNYTSHSVTRRCGTRGRYSMVGIYLARMTDQSGFTDGVQLHYRSGSSAKILTLWFGVALCGTSTSSAIELDPDDNSTRAQVTRMCEPNG